MDSTIPTDVPQKPPAVPIALFGKDATSAQYWASILRTAPYLFKLVAVWSKYQSTAENLYQMIGNAAVQIFYDIPTVQSTAKSDISTIPTIECLLQANLCSGCIIDLPSGTNLEVSSKICKFGKLHMFSAKAPAFTMQEFHNLLESFYGHLTADAINMPSNRFWSINESMYYEPAFVKVKHSLSDIGLIVGAQLTVSLASAASSSNAEEGEVAHMKGVKAQQPSEEFMSACITYAGLLKDLLGDVNSLNFVYTPTKTAMGCMGSSVSDSDKGESLAGYFAFSTGAFGSVVINRIKQLNSFNLCIWGKNGNIAVSSSKGTYEVQRCLHHYEHPSCHTIAGSSWALQAWGERIQLNLPDRNSPLKTFADLALAGAMIGSNGNTIRVKYSDVPKDSYS